MESLTKDKQDVINPVQIGNYMGQKYGQVTAIEEDHVGLVELVPNGTGGWMERDTTIALGDK